MPNVQRLSKGIVPLKRTHGSPGQLVHSAERGGFVTLRYMRYTDLEASDDANLPVWDNSTYIRITVGTQPIGLIHRVLCDGGGIVCENLWVEAGEELWVSTSIANRLAVFGHISDKPL